MSHSCGKWALHLNSFFGADVPHSFDLHKQKYLLFWYTQNYRSQVYEISLKTENIVSSSCHNDGSKKRSIHFVLMLKRENSFVHFHARYLDKIWYWTRNAKAVWNFISEFSDIITVGWTNHFGILWIWYCLHACNACFIVFLLLKSAQMGPQKSMNCKFQMTLSPKS